LRAIRKQPGRDGKRATLPTWSAPGPAPHLRVPGAARASAREAGGR